MMVALHTFDIQILHTDGTHLVVVRECMGYLVKVILSAVGNVFLKTGNTDSSLVTVR